MATYVNNVNWSEDGYGNVHVRFVVSDSYAGLFLPDSDGGVTQVGCIEIDSIKKGMQSGVQASDEVQFSVNAAAINSDDDAACLSYVLAAQDVTVKRYVAVFIDPHTTPINTDIDFVGVVDAQQEATDLRWYGAQYDSAVTPLRNWKFVAKPFQIEFFNNCEIESLVIDSTDGIEATGATWVSSHVADRQAYFHDVRSGTTRDVRFRNLVNINDVLIKLTSIVQGRLRTQLSEPTFTISIDGGTSPFTFTPTRWKTYTSPGDAPYRVRYVAGIKMLANDERAVKIGSGYSDTESPWVHWGLFHPASGAKDLSSWSRCKTYTNFLYHLAYCFGFHLEFTFPSVTEIQIHFVALSEFVRSSVYPVDVKDASLKIAPIAANASNVVRPRNQSSMFSLESSTPEDIYQLSQSGIFDLGTVVQSDAYGRLGSTSNPLLLSISPTLRIQANGEDDSHQLYSLSYYYSDAYVPLGMAHNAVFYDNGSVKHQANPDYYKDDAYRADFPIDSHIHNGIYLKITGVTSGMYDFGVNGTDIWSPAGYVHIDGKDFDKLSDAVNYIGGIELDAAYESKYTLGVPYICRFSGSSTSVHDDWRSLQIGGLITLDGIEFSVTSIERSIRARTTKIEIYNASKFAFSTSTGLATPIVQDLGAGTPIVGTTTPPTSGSYIFDTDASAGDALALLDTGHVVKMSAISSHYGRFIGCAVSNVSATSRGDIATAGEVIQSANYSFDAIGEPAYLRTSGTPETNVKPKSDELRAKRTGESLHLAVGFVLAPDTIKILPSEHWLFR